MAIAGGMLWQLWRGQLVMVGIIIALFVLAVVVIVTPVTGPLAMSLVRRDTVPAGQARSADAVIVLGASVSEAGLLSEEGVDRMVTGMALMREGLAPVLVLSRPAEALRFGSRPDADWRRLLALLPEMPRVEVLDSTETTRDEAVHLRRLAAGRGWKTIYVVTSPLHTRRACASFERVGFTVRCVPSESRDFALPVSHNTFERLGAFAMWLHEVVGWRVYRWRGWV
jgi:uncharacterized SAM-binding protein YcdF (DUF218 family)